MSDPKEGFTRQLARHLFQTSYNDLPSEVTHQAKRLILDALACALGGYYVDPAPMVRAVARELGGMPESTLVGSTKKTSCANATYVNAKTANILDLDDTFYTETHFGTTSIFAPLSICERMGGSGKEFITSVVLGFDLAARVDIATGNPYMVEDGQRPNADRRDMRQGPVLAAAGGAGKALGLNEDQLAHAIGIAAGNMPFNNKYLPADPFNSPVSLFKGTDHGWCGLAGVMAALLAQKGLTAYPTILDRGSPFWNRYAGIEKDFDLLIGRLGEKWYIMDTTFKLWPSCRWSHPPLTAFTKVLEENQLRPEEIERITVFGTTHLASSGFSDQDRQGVLSLQFNIPHAVAMATFRVPPGPEWYSQRVMSDPKIKELKRKVFCAVHPETAKIGRWVEDGQFRKTFGRAEVVARGKTFVAESEYMKGDPWSKETYITDDELKEKFHSAASGLAPSKSWQRRIEEIISTVYHLEEIGDVRELTRLLSP